MDAKTRMRGPANHAERGEFCVARAEGAFVFDTEGRRYIDFIAGWCVGNLGWSRPEIVAALRGFAGPSYVYPYNNYAPWTQLAARLTERAGGDLRCAFRATGGSEAVDIALQAAMLHTGRGKFLALAGSYHGNLISTRAVADSSLRAHVGPLRPSSVKIKPPLDAARLRRVKTLLAKKDVAGVILEPVVCNLGALVPEREFMTGLQALCRRTRTLLILDEVATGFGRTGAMFGFQLYGLEPDIVCLAKAITSGHAPMGATLTTAPVARAVQELGVYSTYGWHPLSVAAALATLDIWARDGEAILANVAAVGRLMRERLARMDFGKGARVQGRGLAIGVVLGKGRDAGRIGRRCREHGLLIAGEDDALTLFPPLVIERAVAEQGLEILEHCLG